MQALRSLIKPGTRAGLTAVPKQCLACNKQIKQGRSDKKFCDDYCRGVYNNELRSSANNYIRNVNNVLTKNRRILESLLPADKLNVKVSRDLLIEKGFRFTYQTQQHTSKNGTYIYCYEYEYLSLENDLILVVRKQ
jgi:predicted nucleic acid-binding Zn ribbon protein